MGTRSDGDVRGFMSQSIVTPKLTGPSGRRHSLPSTRIKRDCVILLQFPSRLKTYVENIQKTLALKEKPNSEKRVVIYYYKGPDKVP